MNEIATYSMILSKTGLGQSGSECPTKQTILSIDSLIIVDNASSYGSRECVRIRDIRKREIETDYVLKVTPTSFGFPTEGGSKSFTVESYKTITIEGSGTSKEDVPWTSSVSGSGFTISGNTVTASANNGESRTGSAIITQATSNKTATISLKQGAAEIGYNYYLSCNPTSLEFEPTGGNKSFVVTSYKKQVINGVEQSEQTPVEWSSATSSAGFSVSDNTVMATNNDYSTRTGEVIVTLAESKKTAKVLLTQLPKPNLPWEYKFDITPWEFNVGATGGTTLTFLIISTKTREGITENVDWSIDSSTIPFWVTFNKAAMTFTVAANASKARNANINFILAETNATEFCRINQEAANIPWDYRFNITPTVKEVTHSDTSATKITVTSTKTRDGVTENVGWKVDLNSIPNWIVYDSTNVSIAAKKNETENTRTASITFILEESNKTAIFKVTQGGIDSYYFAIKFAEETEDKYRETATANSVPANTSGYIIKTTIGSKKNGTQFPYWSMSSDSSWITINGNEFTILSNNTESTRTGKVTYTQNESGLKCYLVVNQLGIQPEYVYTFEFTDEDKDKPRKIASGNACWPAHETYRINSYKQKSKDGVVIDTTKIPVSATYTSTYPVDGAIIINSLSGITTVYINSSHAGMPTINDRYPNLERKEGAMVVTQDESGKQFEFGLLQPAVGDYLIATYQEPVVEVDSFEVGMFGDTNYEITGVRAQLILLETDYDYITNAGYTIVAGDLSFMKYYGNEYLNIIEWPEWVTPQNYTNDLLINIDSNVTGSNRSGSITFEPAPIKYPENGFRAGYFYTEKYTNSATEASVTITQKASISASGSFDLFNTMSSSDEINPMRFRNFNSFDGNTIDGTSIKVPDIHTNSGRPSKLSGHINFRLDGSGEPYGISYMEVSLWAGGSSSDAGTENGLQIASWSYSGSDSNPTLEVDEDFQTTDLQHYMNNSSIYFYINYRISYSGNAEFAMNRGNITLKYNPE